MKLLLILHIISFLIYSYLAVFILVENYKSSLNRICSIFLTCLGLWSFGYIFMNIPQISPDTARLFMNISAIFRTSHPSFFLILALIFSKNEGILNLKKRNSYIIIFLILGILIYKQWDKTTFSWFGAHLESVWPYLYYLYYLSFMGQGLYLILDFMEKTIEPNKKRQAKIISISAIITILIVSMINIVLPEWKIYFVPDITDIVMLVWAIGLVYAIAKYGFLIITPDIAVGNIIATMTDSLILLDKNENIVAVNKAAVNMLEYEEGELEGMLFSVLIAEQGFKNILSDKISKGENIENYEVLFRTKSKKNISVFFSNSLLKDKENNLVSIICIARNIEELKESEKEKIQLQAQLLQIQKMDAIGTLAGGMAHDFNNILCNIRGHADLILTDIKKGNFMYGDLVAIKNNTIQAANLINQLHLLSRDKSEEHKLLNLNNLLNNLQKTLK